MKNIFCSRPKIVYISSTIDVELSTEIFEATFKSGHKELFCIEGQVVSDRYSDLFETVVKGYISSPRQVLEDNLSLRRLTDCNGKIIYLSDVIFITPVSKATKLVPYERIEAREK